MPLLHCDNCHHEWESYVENSKCNWCGSESYVLEKQTELEKFIFNQNHVKILAEFLSQVIKEKE